MQIINIDEQNFEQVAKIYEEGIKTGLATFQNEVPDWQSWDKSHFSVCRIGVCEKKQMVGWSALSPVSSRCVYAGVAEVSVYVSALFRGKGIGKFLLNSLITQSEKAGIWTLQSGIFEENISSIVLHEKCGFRRIGFREKIGKIEGSWKNNVIMERRSKTIGV